MQLILIAGDAMLPSAMSEIPESFKERLVPGKMNHILFTGNLCTRETLDYLRSLCSDVHCVKGRFDTDMDLVDSKTINIGGVDFGLVPGDKAPREAAWGVLREMDVDILVTGSSTMRLSAQAGKIVVSPGSITGAPIRGAAAPPSFIILQLHDTSVTCYIYRFINGETKCDKKYFELNKN
eukprot:TRINITY_DN4710_c0_g1_i2.p1 TRINITY_DN4710_c0_g1~~TRINITY_DN4710_c0_g1_i2.p1  ORF type:complete len:180 (-),score=34.09 TRINITY_DN4710_c0_g1_i2:49-588(-)